MNLSRRIFDDLLRISTKPIEFLSIESERKFNKTFITHAHDKIQLKHRTIECHLTFLHRVRNEHRIDSNVCRIYIPICHHLFMFVLYSDNDHIDNDDVRREYLLNSLRSIDRLSTRRCVDHFYDQYDRASSVEHDRSCSHFFLSDV
jgi:hypothetical protein